MNGLAEVAYLDRQIAAGTTVEVVSASGITLVVEEAPAARPRRQETERP